jgi:CDP-diglyceride synthetase
MSVKSKAMDFLTDEQGIPLAASPDSRGQVGTVISVVTIGIVAIIGILIYSQVNQSLPAPENSDLNNSSEEVTDGFGSAMNLVPIVLIVLVASLVIAVVQQFGQ